MSPEVAFEQGHDFKVDTWAVGILLYEMLHGKTPFKSDGVESL
jgi:serine/threonine protein kinase